MSFVLFVSKRYLKLRENFNFTSFVTITSVLGVAVGVMTLIVVIAVMTGFESDFKSRIIGLRPHLIISDRDSNAMLEYDAIIKQIKTISGVTHAVASVTTQAIISNQKITLGAVIKGVQNYEKLLPDINVRKYDLYTHKKNKTPTIVLSNNLIKALCSTEGSMVYVTSPKGLMSPLGYIPCIKKFQVVGSVEFNPSSFSAYISISEAQKLLKIGNSATAIEVKLGKNISTEKVTNEILSKAGNSISVKNWKEMNNNLCSAMKLEKIVMFIILSLVVLIATFSITASLAMSVFNKRQEIALLKVLGATNKDIGRIFIAKGMILGLVGTILGTLTGIFVSLIISIYPVVKLPEEIYSITKLPVDMRTYDIVLIILSAMFMSFIATIYPAKKAAHTNIIQTINNK